MEFGFSIFQMWISLEKETHFVSNGVSFPSFLFFVFFCVMSYLLFLLCSHLPPSLTLPSFSCSSIVSSLCASLYASFLLCNLPYVLFSVVLFLPHVFPSFYSYYLVFFDSCPFKLLKFILNFLDLLCLSSFLPSFLPAPLYPLFLGSFSFFCVCHSFLPCPFFIFYHKSFVFSMCPVLFPVLSSLSLIVCFLSSFLFSVHSFSSLLSSSSFLFPSFFLPFFTFFVSFSFSLFLYVFVPVCLIT